MESTDTLANLTGNFTDVRNVAKGLTLLPSKNVTQGESLLLAKDLFTTQSNLDLIRKDLPKLDSQIPKGDPPKTEDWKKI